MKPHPSNDEQVEEGLIEEFDEKSRLYSEDELFTEESKGDSYDINML
jgi:hypothetical protein